MSLITDYRQKVLPSLQKKLGLKNIHQVPRLEKITVNIGIGSYTLRKDKDFEPLVERVAKITGQKPVVVKAKKAISNFKLRKGFPNGIMVTLRGKQMLYFLEKLIGVALPRTRDFRGVPKKSFDKSGNYSLGVKEVTIFPEIQLDDLSKMHGLQINMTIKSQKPEFSAALLQELGLPFAK